MLTPIESAFVWLARTDAETMAARRIPAVQMAGATLKQTDDENKKLEEEKRVLIEHVRLLCKVIAEAHHERKLVACDAMLRGIGIATATIRRLPYADARMRAFVRQEVDTMMIEYESPQYQGSLTGIDMGQYFGRLPVLEVLVETIETAGIRLPPELLASARTIRDEEHYTGRLDGV
jgi:hypothetical protein